MGWRSELEDRYTVVCEECEEEVLEPSKRPAQRYLLDRPCPRCGHVRRRRT